MKNRIINLMQKDVVIVDRKDNKLQRIQARDHLHPAYICKRQIGEKDKVDEIPVICTKCVYSVNLPEAEAGVYYIVEDNVRHYFPERQDLLSPKQIGESEHVIWCRCLEGNA